jgi:hypothetical protein
LLTVGVRPHAFSLFTTTASTPKNIADRRMLPKF